MIVYVAASISVNNENNIPCILRLASGNFENWYEGHERGLNGRNHNSLIPEKLDTRTIIIWVRARVCVCVLVAFSGHSF